MCLNHVFLVADARTAEVEDKSKLIAALSTLIPAVVVEASIIAILTAILCFRRRLAIIIIILINLFIYYTQN